MSASLHEELLVRSARLSAVPPGWHLATVGEVCAIRNDLRKPISKEERKGMRGIYPYYGPTGVLDHINEYRLDDTYALIGEDGDHFLEYTTKQQTQLVKGKANVNNHAHVIESTAQCTAEWFFNFFRHRNITDFLSRQGAGRYKLNKETLERLPILVPPMSVQEAINCTISIWDTAIEKTEQLIAAKERHFSGLVRQLITDRANSESSWKRHPISEIADRIQRQTDGGSYPLLTISSASGFVRQEEKYSRYMAGESAKTYTLLRMGEFAYNKGNSLRYEFGCIFQLQDYEAALVPSVYVSFKLHDSVCASYMRHLFAADYLKSQLRALVKTGVRNNGLLNIRPDEFMGTTVPMPPLAEQKRISRVLDAARQEIALLTKQLVALRNQKRGLMQKLLTGQWRVKVPEGAEVA